MEKMGLIVTGIIGYTTDVIGVMMTEPAVYFVGVALVGAVAGIARKFVPMRKS